MASALNIIGSVASAWSSGIRGPQLLAWAVSSFPSVSWSSLSGLVQAAVEGAEAAAQAGRSAPGTAIPGRRSPLDRQFDRARVRVDWQAGTSNGHAIVDVPVNSTSTFAGIVEAAEQAVLGETDFGYIDSGAPTTQPLSVAGTVLLLYAR